MGIGLNEINKMKAFIKMYKNGTLPDSAADRYGGKDRLKEIADKFQTIVEDYERRIVTDCEHTDKQCETGEPGIVRHHNPNPEYQKKVWKKLAELNIGHMNGEAFIIDDFEAFLAHQQNNFAEITELLSKE